MAMNDMYWERRRLAEQMRRDLRDLTFSPAMREAVLARVRAEESEAPHLRAVPPLPAEQGRGVAKSVWRRTGLWLGGGTAAAAALVVAVLFSGQGRGPALPPQIVAQAPTPPASVNVLHAEHDYGEPEAVTAGSAGDTAMMMATETAAPDDAGLGPDGTAAMSSPDGGDEADLAGEEMTVSALEDGTDLDDAGDADRGTRPVAGVAAQPGQGADGRGTRGRESSRPPAATATWRDLDQEAELVVVAQVREIIGARLTLAPLQALRGSLPGGDLTVTLPNGRSGLASDELVIVFLRATGASGDRGAAGRPADGDRNAIAGDDGGERGERGERGNGPPAHAAAASQRWKLVGGMAGIFRISADGQQAQSSTETMDVDVLTDELR